jgi:POT family proton-dependent oligopeptide transporter
MLYYELTAIVVNFIQQPLPPGSTTGAGFAGQSGALGMGQRASTGLVTFNQFWAYVMPLFGAYLADAKFGRYKTIHIAIGCAIVGHLILVASAAPSVIGKPNTSPLLAEQQRDVLMRVETLASGERVLVDPAVTTSRLFLYFCKLARILSEPR